MQFIVNIFTTLRTRPFAVALLVYQLFFFNLFLPGHTRGAITLDGKHTTDPSAAVRSCCCCGCDSPAGAMHDSKQAPSQRDKDCCAICHFAATVMPTPIVGIVLPELGLLEVLSLARPCVPAPADLIHVYQSRGPPALV